MPGAYVSRARVRTRTGCLECRKSHKKCDERRPKCQRCGGKGLACTWPTALSQPVDGRRREAQRWNPGRRLAIDPDEHQSLINHFVKAVMPRLVRRDCLAECRNQSYLLQLAAEFPPLTAVLMAIAAVDLGKDDLAMERYLYSLRSLQDRMTVIPDAGNEDGLLATTICLCVFENHRPDVPPNIGVHMKAAGVLLSRRARTTASQEMTRPTVAFERICIESFLYHTTLLMLFDPSLDGVLASNLPHYLEYAISDSQRDATTRPILDGPYHFFLLIADVTRLARISRLLNELEHQTWTRLQERILHEDHTVDADDLVRKLYVRAMQILLLKVDSTRPTEQKTAAIYAHYSEGLDLLRAFDVQQHLLSYELWPMAVLGAIATDQEEQHMIERKISPWTGTRRGQAVRLQERLRHIWAFRPEAGETMPLRQLQMLLDAS